MPLCFFSFGNSNGSVEKPTRCGYNFREFHRPDEWHQRMYTQAGDLQGVIHAWDGQIGNPRGAESELSYVSLKHT